MRRNSRTVTRAVMAAASLSFLAQAAMAYDAKPSDVFMGYDNGRRIELFMRAAPIALVQTLPSCMGKFFAISTKDGADEQYGCWNKTADTVAIDWAQAPSKLYPASVFYLR